MILISHRGNISGPSTLENSPDLINDSLSKGFDVEVDIRYIRGEWWLGHDSPQYLIPSLDIFDCTRIWWHCKNFDALQKLSGSNYNYFWHQTDDHTLTSNGFIWTFPGKEIGKLNIIVMPETVMPISDIAKLEAFAICSDYVLSIKEWRLLDQTHAT